MFVPECSRPGSHWWKRGFIHNLSVRKQETLILHLATSKLNHMVGLLSMCSGVQYVSVRDIFPFQSNSVQKVKNGKNGDPNP